MRYFRIYNTQCRMAVSSLTAGERTVCVQARSDTLQPNIPSTLPYEVLRSSLVINTFWKFAFRNKLMYFCTEGKHINESVNEPLFDTVFFRAIYC